MEDSACGGFFCDRQITSSIPSEQVPCGCFHRADRHKCVGIHILRIPCEGHIHESRRVTVRGFRSSRFDQLIFRDGSQKMFEGALLRDPIANLVLRRHVARLLTLVNDRHGWTVIGWVRTGKVKDASEEGNRDAIDLASEDVKPHIIYLQPTNKGDVDEKTVEEYKDLLITEAAFSDEMKKEMEEQKKNDEKRKEDKRKRKEAKEKEDKEKEKKRNRNVDDNDSS